MARKFFMFVSEEDTISTEYNDWSFGILTLILLGFINGLICWSIHTTLANIHQLTGALEGTRNESSIRI